MYSVQLLSHDIIIQCHHAVYKNIKEEKVQFNFLKKNNNKNKKKSKTQQNTTFKKKLFCIEERNNKGKEL